MSYSAILTVLRCESILSVLQDGQRPIQRCVEQNIPNEFDADVLYKWRPKCVRVTLNGYKSTGIGGC